MFYNGSLRLRNSLWPDMVVHACNPSSQEALKLEQSKNKKDKHSCEIFYICVINFPFIKVFCCFLFAFGILPCRPLKLGKLQNSLGYFIVIIAIIGFKRQV
jgi:hypothetical protein